MTSTLPKRPDATTYAIEDLVPMAKKGTFRLPSLQRLFKWESSHVRDLFDSIYRGFPIGTLLLWKKEAEAGIVRFGPRESPVEVRGEKQMDALWIVDGQQRVSSLVGVLSPSATPAGVFRLFFDLEWEDAPGDRPTPFVADRTTLTPPSTWLPMNVVLDSEQLDAWLDDSGVRSANPEHARRARRLNKVLREYKIPAYVVETEDLENLVLIFERVNNAGKRLDKGEVFNASLSSVEGGQSLLGLARQVQDLGFGKLDQDTLLRVVLATKDLDITNAGTEQFHKVRSDVSAMVEAERALLKAIELIRRDAGIPHASLLPYMFPLIVLSKFFRQHPNPQPRSRVLLARWVWRGAISGQHRAAHTPDVRAVLKDLNADSGMDEESVVQKLLSWVPRERPAAEEHPFRFNTAQSKLELLALSSLAPRNLVDGSSAGSAELGPLFAASGGGAALLDVGPLLEQHGSEAVLAIWAGSEGAAGPPARTLANLLIHPPIGRRLLMGALRSAAPEILMSHGIGIEAAEALRARDYARMIELRGDFLRRHVASFLDAHARWGETDRPSLAWLVRRPISHEGGDDEHTRV